MSGIQRPISSGSCGHPVHREAISQQVTKALFPLVMSLLPGIELDRLPIGAHLKLVA